MRDIAPNPAILAACLLALTLVGCAEFQQDFGLVSAAEPARDWRYFTLSRLEIGSAWRDTLGYIGPPTDYSRMNAEGGLGEIYTYDVGDRIVSVFVVNGLVRIVKDDEDFR